MKLTWYDVLGLTPDATSDQIKAAWRDATDKFEPGSGSGQFQMFNEAADVLLNPDKRREYDASLAAAASPETEPVAEPVAGSVAGPVAGPVAEPVPAAGADEGGEPETSAPRASRLLTVVALVLLPILTIGSLALLGVTIYQHHRDGQLDDARTAAPAAAERAFTTMLAYDYRNMTASRDATVKYLTPTYRKKEYLPTFALLTKGKNGGPGPAVATKTVVTADVLDTAVVDAEPDEVRVLVFVNQTSKKGTAAPVIFQNRVVADMVKSGNQWLIDGVKSY